jgi:oligo-1,6-glucosidase
MIFHFDIVRIDHDNWRKIDRTLTTMKATYSKIDLAAGEYGWNTSFLGNHDNPRVVSHFGDDSTEWWARSAKALATLTLTQRATPFLYQGDELGMTNFPFQSIDEFDDVEVKGLWRTLVQTGQVPAEELLRNLRHTSRDHSRTPMQWNDEANAGFSARRPWLAVNPNYRQINAAAQVDDPDSVFNHHRRLIELRRRTPALIHGTYLDIDPTHEQVFGYTRTLGDVTLLVLMNMSNDDLDYGLPNGLAVAETLLTNVTGDALPAGSTRVPLSGWQATIYTVG